MQNKRLLTHPQSGFTLIELIMTLVILGLCSTLMFGGLAYYANVYVTAQTQTIEESSREASLMVLINLLKHAPTASVTSDNVTSITTEQGSIHTVSFDGNALNLNGASLVAGLIVANSSLTAQISAGAVTKYELTLKFTDQKTVHAVVEPEHRRQTYVP